MKLGEHLLIDIICDNDDILYSLNKLEQFTNSIIHICKLNKLSRIKHEFVPYGITLVTLLQESHISIHTWPENKSVCIDIFSCKDSLNIETIKDIITQYFVINKIKIKLVERCV